MKGHVTVFTTEIFAQYFSIKHLLVARCRLLPKAQEQLSVHAEKLCLHEEVKLFSNRIMSAPRLLLSDLMLCKLPNNQTANDCLSGNSQRQMVSLITRLSLQQLLTYRHPILPRDIAIIDVSDFRALFLYRCLLYERCEQLCQQRICELIDADSSCSIPRMSTMYHEFVQLMDDDIVSVFGLIALMDKSKVQSWFSYTVTISQLTM